MLVEPGSFNSLFILGNLKMILFVHPIFRLLEKHLRRTVPLLSMTEPNDNLVHECIYIFIYTALEIKIIKVKMI